MNAKDQAQADLMSQLEEIQELAERAGEHKLAAALYDLERLWLVGLEGRAHALYRPLVKQVLAAMEEVADDD